MLAPAAHQQAAAHLAALDDVLPGRVTGYYLVGSAALGDWEERVSNLDVVVVADEWPETSAAAAARLDGRLAVGDEPPAVWVTTWSALAEQAPTGEGLDTPLTRAILAEDAIAVRGSDWITVGGVDELAGWAQGQLSTVWRKVAQGAHPPGTLWRRKPLAEMLLEVCRLSVAATAGTAVSKVRAAALVAGEVPGRFDRVLNDAAGFRQGSRTSLYWGPAERKSASLELIRLLTDG